MVYLGGGGKTTLNTSEKTAKMHQENGKADQRHCRARKGEKRNPATRENFSEKELKKIQMVKKRRA